MRREPPDSQMRCSLKKSLKNTIERDSLLILSEHEQNLVTHVYGVDESGKTK